MGGNLLRFEKKKAFDKVDYHLLLQKVKIYKFHYISLTWMNSYLSNRQQCLLTNLVDLASYRP